MPARRRPASAQAPPATTLARLVVAGNFAWVAASLAALVPVGPNALGAAFLLAQAAVVAALALLEARVAARRRVIQPGLIAGRPVRLR